MLSWLSLLQSYFISLPTFNTYFYYSILFFLFILFRIVWIHYSFKRSLKVTSAYSIYMCISIIIMIMLREIKKFWLLLVVEWVSSWFCYFLFTLFALVVFFLFGPSLSSQIKCVCFAALRVPNDCQDLDSKRGIIRDSLLKPDDRTDTFLCSWWMSVVFFVVVNLLSLFPFSLFVILLLFECHEWLIYKALEQ